jgi:hypothetical protein
MAEISAADVRHWSNLPANIYLARAQVPNGLRGLLIRTPTGSLVGRQIAFNGDKNIVYIRIFRDRASMMSSNDVVNGFQNTGQPIATVIKNAPVSLNVPPSQPNSIPTR